VSISTFRNCADVLTNVFAWCLCCINRVPFEIDCLTIFVVITVMLEALRFCILAILSINLHLYEAISVKCCRLFLVSTYLAIFLLVTKSYNLFFFCNSIAQQYEWYITGFKWPSLVCFIFRQNVAFNPNATLLPTLPTYPSVQNDFRDYNRFSNATFRVKKHFKSKCSWKLAAFILLLVCVALSAVVAYFLGKCVCVCVCVCCVGVCV